MRPLNFVEGFSRAKSETVPTGFFVTKLTGPTFGKVSKNLKKERKKYVVRGQTIHTPNSQNLRTQSRYSGSQTVLTRKSSEIELRSKTKSNPKSPLGRRRMRMKDFTYEDLNPNYLIDQYYYTRLLRSGRTRFINF